MSFGFLAGVLVWTLVTVAAWAPPRRPHALARLGYLAGMVVNEVPLLAVAALLVTVVPALVSGEADDSRGSVIVTAVAGAAVLLALALARRGWSADAHAAAAVAAAGLDPGLVHGGPAHRSRLRVLLTPLPVRPRSVQRLGNLDYGPHRRQRLDVYRRRAGGPPGPVLVYLHGGGYFSGSKRREARALLHELARRGWVCVSATYRLRPRAGFEDHLTDAKLALAWAHRNAARLGGDPSTLVMAGSSAGAHLTALCALTQGRPDLQPGFEAADTQVSAAVCLYGWYGRYYGRDASESPVSSPLALDTREAPPFLVAHGTLDSYTPVAGARDLTSRLRAASSHPVVHLELPGGQHGFDIVRSWRFQAVLGALDALLDRVAAGAAPRPTGGTDHGGATCGS
jgi:acetyl esterase/lipase